MRFEGLVDPPRAGSRTRISVKSFELATARLGFLVSGQLDNLACLPVGDDLSRLTPAQAEYVVVGNIALLREVGSRLAEDSAFKEVHNTITSGVQALQAAALHETIVFPQI